MAYIWPFVDFALDIESGGGGTGAFTFNVLTAPWRALKAGTVTDTDATYGPGMLGGVLPLPATITGAYTSAAPALTVTSASIDGAGNVSISLSGAFVPSITLYGRFTF